MTVHRCDGTDEESTRRIGLDEPLLVRSASEEIRSRVPGGDLTAALDNVGFDSHGYREISFKLGGGLTSRSETRTRKVLATDDTGRTIACDCGRAYDDEQFSTVYPHEGVRSGTRPDRFDLPVIERAEADSDRVDREAAELADRRRIAAEAEYER